MFELHPQLEKDCFHVADLSLCRILLMNDRQYPWFILVPMVNDIREIIDMSAEQQQLFWQESAHLSRVVTSVFEPYKLNVAALGNMVPQLHIHHIARFEDDAAWPKPVWGVKSPQPYTQEQVDVIMENVRSQL